MKSKDMLLGNICDSEHEIETEQQDNHSLNFIHAYLDAEGF